MFDANKKNTTVLTLNGHEREELPRSHLKKQRVEESQMILLEAISPCQEGGSLSVVKPEALMTKRHCRTAPMPSTQPPLFLRNFKIACVSLILALKRTKNGYKMVLTAE